jgi:hypothetical protein
MLLESARSMSRIELGRERLLSQGLLFEGAAHDTGSRPAMAGQAHEPTVQHLAALLS